MSDKKISQLPALTGADAEGVDEYAIVDSSVSVTKKMTREELFKNTPDIFVGTAGAIGSASGELFVGSYAGNDAFLKFGFDSVAPSTSTGGNRDNAIDLGKATSRFKDLRLSGNVIVVAGKGIDFSADGQAAGMTSELLDDYEEGTWTPSITGLTSNSGQAYDLQVGRYTKIGRLVTVEFHIKFSTEGTFSGALLQLSGLPFTINNFVPAVSGGLLLFGSMATNFITVGLQLNQNSTNAFLTATTAAAAGTGYVGINDLTDTTLLTGQFTYSV